MLLTGTLWGKPFAAQEFPSHVELFRSLAPDADHDEVRCWVLTKSKKGPYWVELVLDCSQVFEALIEFGNVVLSEGQVSIQFRRKPCNSPNTSPTKPGEDSSESTTLTSATTFETAPSLGLFEVNNKTDPFTRNEVNQLDCVLVLNFGEQRVIAVDKQQFEQFVVQAEKDGKSFDELSLRHVEFDDGTSHDLVLDWSMWTQQILPVSKALRASYFGVHVSDKARGNKLREIQQGDPQLWARITYWAADFRDMEALEGLEMPCDESVPHASAALSTAKNAAYVGKAITEAIQAAKSDDVETSQLLAELQKQVSERTLYSYGKVEHYKDTEFAPSPLYTKLIEAHKCLRVSDNTSRILYAPPSSGKTTAAKMFMKLVLGSDLSCPGLMFTGVSHNSNYFESIMDCFAEYEADPASVIKCLIAALSRSAKATQSSPWLILDEFNLKGEDEINMVFAETLFRQVAERQLNFNILFITQKKQMANDLLALNSWQKISPLPRFTSPDSSTILNADIAPPDGEFSWLKMPWTRRQLTMVVFLRYPDLKNDTENIDDEDGEDVFKLLTGCESPTGACKIAAERQSQIQNGGEKPRATIYENLMEKSQSRSNYL